MILQFIYISTFIIAAAQSASVTQCSIWPDMVAMSGYTWQERCRNCSCVEGVGTVCDGPTCANPYHPSQEMACARWSPDGCCCLENGCKKHGKVFKFGEYYPVAIDDPCYQCQCRADMSGRPTCKHDMCKEECVDGVRVEGVCCPVCQNGPNCRIPDLLTVDNQLVQHAPISFNTTTIVTEHIDSTRAWSCNCTIPGGVAVCQIMDHSLRQALLALVSQIMNNSNP